MRNLSQSENLAFQIHQIYYPKEKQPSTKHDVLHLLKQVISKRMYAHHEGLVKHKDTRATNTKHVLKVDLTKTINVGSPRLAIYHSLDFNVCLNSHENTNYQESSFYI